MRKPAYVYALCAFCLLPLASFADSVEESEPSEEIADNSVSTADWRQGHETSPSTNPKWYRNPEARDAYLRGEGNYRNYPRQGNSKTKNDSARYQQISNEERTPITNPRWKKDPQARDAYLRGDKNYRQFPESSGK